MEAIETREAKLAVARQKLKDHQQKKTLSTLKENIQSTEYKKNAEESTIEKTFECGQLKVMSTEPIDYTEHHFNKMEKSQLEIGQHLGASEVLTTMNYEKKIEELTGKLLEMEKKLSMESQNNSLLKHNIQYLENQLKDISDKYMLLDSELTIKNEELLKCTALKDSLRTDSCNLQEQLEFTKNMLTSLENENAALDKNLMDLTMKYDTTQLQLQQLTNDATQNFVVNSKAQTDEDQEALLKKIFNLEQQLKVALKEKDQTKVYYEHYTRELNEQLRSSLLKLENFIEQVEYLSSRETSLIDQISDLEVRLQTNNQIKDNEDTKEREILKLNNTLEKKLSDAHESLKTLIEQNDILKKQLANSNEKIKEMIQIKESNENQDEISITKLTADITSDKIAAQRATEQNKKLKSDVQELQEAFVKLTKDKLELTEKIAAEKFLNRELTIKLSEVEETANDLHIKLMAKDEEMIRLQNYYRIEQKTVTESKTILDENTEAEDGLLQRALMDNKSDVSIKNECLENNNEVKSVNCTTRIQKEDAMLKLQDRFLKIMSEVADLSDEKHRLEHIIIQLQTETDTICEYVALYQQQRILLKKRDEERSAQIKLFKMECDQLKSYLEELSRILVQFAQDKELQSYFQNESKQNDLAKVMNLLSNLQNSTFVDPERNHVDLNNFYPCSCCSGQLIEV